MNRECLCLDIMCRLLTPPSVDIVEIDEPCAHEVQYGGLCAECGKDMTE